MAFRMSILCCFLMTYVLSANAAAAPAAKAVLRGPQNAALEVGPGVVLGCQATASSAVIEWREYITNAGGATISFNNQTLPGHPNAGRYTIVYREPTVEYDLQIQPTQLIDGGTYRCQDNADIGTPVAYAQLVILEGPPVCTSNIPVSGVVIEGTYYVIECTITFRGNAAPMMTWTGPEEWRGEWGQIITNTNTTVFSGVNMNMSRYFDAQQFSVLANFTERGFLGPNSASNIPTWNYTLTSPVLSVFWRPGHMYIIPEQASYEIGQVIECWSDGNPSPDYFWHSSANNEFWFAQAITLRADMVGTATFRCHAQNDYGENELYVNITINPVTTPTVPPTTTTTTPPPAQGQCYDLTGRWTASSPSLVDFCLEVNKADGTVVGLFRNATDPVFIEVRGLTKMNRYDQIGFAGVWPINIGTQGFVGVCSNCFGIEHLQVTAVGRTITDFQTCSNFGQLKTFQFYDFVRTGPPCRGLFAEYGIKL